MKKTRLWWFLLIFFLTGCQALPPSSEVPFEFTFETIDEQVYITGYVGKIPKNLTLPAKMDDDPVYGIKKDAFRLAKVESIFVPASIEVIESGAFYAAKLHEITFHKDSKLRLIQSYAFAYTELIEIEIPASVVSLDDYAFTHSTLEEIQFKSNAQLKTIGKYAFYNNVLLNFIVLPEGITSIGDYAFYAAFKLDFVTIPASVTSIGVEAFGFTRLLTRIEVDGDNLQYKDINGVLLSKDGKLLIHYPSNHLERIYTLPDSVTFIEDHAFMGSRIESIVFSPNTQLRTIGKMAFKQTRLKGNIHIPSGVTAIYEEAFFTKDIKSIFIPDTVTSIGEDAFDKFYIQNIFVEFEENTINKTNALNFVLGNVFYEATYGETAQFSYIQFPTEVYVYEYINTPVTYEITIPDTINGLPVTRILTSAFMNTFITKVTIGMNVEVIHSRAFLNAEKLQTVEFVSGSKIQSINGFSFYGTDALDSLTLPTGLTTIQFGAFMSSGLEYIYIPNTVNNIAMNVFLDNPTLTIYTEFKFTPSTWDASFNPDNVPLVYESTP